MHLIHVGERNILFVLDLCEPHKRDSVNNFFFKTLEYTLTMASSVSPLRRVMKIWQIILLSFQVEKYFFIKIHEYVNTKPLLH